MSCRLNLPNKSSSLTISLHFASAGRQSFVPSCVKLATSSMFLLVFFSSLTTVLSQEIIIPPAKGCPAKPVLVCDPIYPYRSFDGTCNNLKNPTWGSVNECVSRLLPADYGEDPKGQKSVRRAKSGKPLPNARVISNAYHKDNRKNDSINNVLLTQFGMSLTADITNLVEPHRWPYGSITEVTDAFFPCCTLTKPAPKFCDPISIEKSDEFYSKHGISCMNKFRSRECERCIGQQREQRNSVNSFIDLQNIYGNTKFGHLALREGKGKLIMSADAKGRVGLPPRNLLNPPLSSEFTDDNCDPKINGVCFLPGIINVQPTSVAFQTTLLRQHNRVADALATINPLWSDDRLFQETRRIVAAQFQTIVYQEYLPVVIGKEKMTHFKLWTSDKTTEYDPKLNPSVLNEFGTAAFRFGHSNVQDQFMHVNSTGGVSFSNVQDQYFHPIRVFNGQFDEIMRGMTRQPQAAFDASFTGAVRNHLYQPVTGPNLGQDLPALNIQRGRDHGLRGYIHYVKHCDGFEVKKFADLEKYMTEMRWKKLSEIYEHPNDIDLYPGGLSERPLPGAVVGPTFACIIGEQFKRFKFGDRFYFEHRDQAGSFTSDQLKAIRKTKLAALVCNNGDDFGQVQTDVFHLPSDKNQVKPCGEIHDILMDLNLWSE